MFLVYIFLTFGVAPAIIFLMDCGISKASRYSSKFSLSVSLKQPRIPSHMFISRISNNQELFRHFSKLIDIVFPHHKFITDRTTRLQHKCRSAKAQKWQSAKVLKRQVPGARCHAYLTSHSILAPCLHNQTAVHHLQAVPLKSSLLEWRVIYNTRVP